MAETTKTTDVAKLCPNISYSSFRCSFFQIRFRCTVLTYYNDILALKQSGNKRIGQAVITSPFTTVNNLLGAMEATSRVLSHG